MRCLKKKKDKSAWTLPLSKASRQRPMWLSLLKHLLVAAHCWKQSDWKESKIRENCIIMTFMVVTLVETLLLWKHGTVYLANELQQGRAEHKFRSLSTWAWITGCVLVSEASGTQSIPFLSLVVFLSGHDLSDTDLTMGTMSWLPLVTLKRYPKNNRNEVLCTWHCSKIFHSHGHTVSLVMQFVHFTYSPN